MTKEKKENTTKKGIKSMKQLWNVRSVKEAKYMFSIYRVICMLE